MTESTKMVPDPVPVHGGSGSDRFQFAIDRFGSVRSPMGWGHPCCRAALAPPAYWATQRAS